MRTTRHDKTTTIDVSHKTHHSAHTALLYKNHEVNTKKNVVSYGLVSRAHQPTRWWVLINSDWFCTTKETTQVFETTQQGQRISVVALGAPPCPRKARWEHPLGDFGKDGTRHVSVGSTEKFGWSQQSASHVGAVHPRGYCRE